jgi:hypothetical protein
VLAFPKPIRVSRSPEGHTFLVQHKLSRFQRPVPCLLSVIAPAAQTRTTIEGTLKCRLKIAQFRAVGNTEVINNQPFA